MPKSQRITAQQWVPSGNEFVIDGLWGRLGFQEQFGDTKISGSANGLAVRVDEAAGKVYLYAGASNGGVHLRVYDKATDRWDDAWSWQSRPGSGYEGAQAIAVLAVSEDGQYLAAAQGDPSNYASVAPPSDGVQIGRINSDGSISWLTADPSIAQELQGLNVRSLKWHGSNLLATTWNYDKISKEGTGAEIRIETSADGITGATVASRPNINLVLDHAANNTLVAGYSEVGWLNLLELNGVSLVGNNYEHLKQDLESEGLQIARLSLFPELVDGNLVAFLGSFRRPPSETDRSDNIARIDRIEISPETGYLSDIKTYSVPSGVIGTGQGSNARYYGNFSLQADPYDPQAMGVFSGGNQFGSSSISRTPTSSGGLVRVDFRSPELEPELLYGLRYNDAAAVTPFNPGQPHADSRTIAFYPSSSGPVLLETDDGGVWQLPMQVSSDGASLANGAWWQSLTSEGLSTLELNMVGWNSHTNAIASSYQDNAASLGYYGENHASNFWMGDGQVALFDDAGKRHQVNGYLSGYWYIAAGNWERMSYDKDGFIKGGKNAPFFLKDSDGSPSVVPWSFTAEANPLDPEKVPFILPVEANAYRPGSVVMTGQFNIYEQVRPGSDVKQQNGLLFRSLLKSNVDVFKSTSIDNQGSSFQGIVESLYVGALIGNDASGEPVNPQVVLYGRQSSNRRSAYKLERLEFSNLSADELTRGGQIQDVAHAASQYQPDTIYWLQGGVNIPFDPGNQKGAGTSPSQQILRIGEAGGSVKTYNLVQDLGLQLSEGDHYGQQALVYVPATKLHTAKLVIGGQQGIWSTDLDPDGQPVGFTQMDWKGLPDQGPGSYVRSILYDPQDDLLIAATQGQGSFLYSFSGQLGRRPKPTSILHLSNLDVQQSPTPALDKRGNEVHDTITIALDSRLQDSAEATELRIKLHDPAAWRKAMEYVSLYNINLNPNVSTVDPTVGGGEITNLTNLLTPEGVATVGGKQNNNAITVPLTMAPGSTLFNLIVNYNEASTDKLLKPLKYSVGLADGSEKLTRRVKFIPYKSDSKLSSANRNALERVDAITGSELSQPALINPSNLADQSQAGRITLASQSGQDVICGVYWVQSTDGAVLSADGQLLKPGDPGYAAAALRDANLGASFVSSTSATTQSELIGSKQGTFLAPFAKVNGEILFAFDPDGADQRKAFKALGSGAIGLEDYAASGTVDFTDLILTYQAAPLA